MRDGEPAPAARTRTAAEGVSTPAASTHPTATRVRPSTSTSRGKTTGCTPDLENPPDCPVEAALGCAESACLTGCSDFFLCKATSTGPQWIDVAYCDCDGQLLVTQ